MKDKKIFNVLKWALGIIFSLCLILTALITSVEIAVYADYGYFEKEYEKYQVNSPGSIVDMDMEELMRVTKEMMAYLKGNREDLVVYAVIDGRETEFFNDIEKFHMADCQRLFIGAIWIRRAAAALMLIIAAVMLILRWKLLKYIAGGFIRTIAVLAAAAFFLVVYISLDFTRAFTQFHQIFFDNDMWLLDPDTDRLINIVPEGFFIDTAVRIGIIFGVIIIAVLILFVFMLVFFNKRSIIKGTEKTKKLHDGGTYGQG